MKLADLKRFRARHAGLIAVGLVAAVIFFVVGAGLRLLMGPVSITPFSDRLSQAIGQALPGVAVKFDSASLGWSPADGRVDLIVLGARVFDSRGRIIAQAPRADLAVASSALMSGTLEVQRITLVGVQLTLVRTRDGGLRMGVSNDKDQPDLLKMIREAIAKSSGPTTLQSFAVQDARLAFYDETSGLFIVAPNATMKVASASGGMAASLNADIEISGRQAHVAANISLPSNNTPSSGHFALTGLNLAALGRNAKVFSALKIAEVNVDLSADVVFSGNKLSTVKFQSSGQGGLEGLGPKGGELALGTIRATGTYDGNTGHITLDDGTASGGQVNLHVAGTGQLTYDGNDNLTQATLDADIDNVAVDMPGIFPGVMRLTDVKFSGGYTPATGEADLKQFSIRGPHVTVDMTGKTVFGNASPAIDLSGRIAATTVREALNYWPATLGSGAHDWIEANITEGDVGPIVIEAHIPAGALDAPALPESALNISFPFSNIAGTYIKGLTPATEVNGTGLMTGDTFTATITQAKIGNIAVTGGKGIIKDIHAPVALGEFSVHQEGAIPELLTLIDMKPLGYPTRFGIDPKDSKGQAAIDVAVSVPMLRDVNVNDIDVKVSGKVTSFEIALGKSTRIANGDITFEVDNDHLHAAGNAIYANQNVVLDWTEDFKTTDDITTRLNAQAIIDQAGRTALGVDLGDTITGPVGVTAVLNGHRGQLRTADLTLDLTKAHVAVDLIGIDKPTGTPATSNILATFGSTQKVQSADLKMTGKLLNVEGTARFDDSGALSALDLPIVKSGPNNDFALSLTRGPNAAVDVTIKGKSLNGAGLASRGSKPASKEAPKEQKFDGPFHVSVHLDHLTLRDGMSMAPFVLDMSGIEDRLQMLDVSGALPKNATVTGKLEKTEKGRRLKLATTDAGELIHGLFGLDSIKDGKINVTADFAGDGNQPGTGDDPDFQGTMVAEDFRIQHQPFLARLFAAGSLTGFIDLMSSKGIAIDKLTVPFKSKSGIINIREAHASGPAIGFSADGFVDRPKNEIGLRGTLAPLYGINSVLGAIPLLGSVLTSREGEGILGTTYAVHGNADEPEISVNPLSMLTPGILRRIFEGKIPTAKPATPTAKPPALAGPAAATPAPKSTTTTPAEPDKKPSQSATNP
ncbi:MAG TPA: AsmA-like C-terminal domain-containing protein [Rhizomicrobium sp.]|nr:AsmA-like C-terminal domain-containing protein [Rhizomicrobium sp.]